MSLNVYLVGLITAVTLVSCSRPANEPYSAKDSFLYSGAPKQPAPSEPSAAPRVNPESRWVHRSTKSSFDDSPIETVFLDAENSITGWLKEEKPTLVIRCSERKTEVYIHVGMPAAVEYGTDGATVRIRLDSEPAVTSHASQSNDNSALFLEGPIDSAKAMVDSKKMVFGFTPFNANPVQVMFNLEGIKEAIEPVRKACRW